MYIIMDDCNETDGNVYDTLTAARKARAAELDEIGQHMGDHLHVMTLDGRYISEPGAWKVTLDDAHQTMSGNQTVLHYKAHEVATADYLWYEGLAAVKPIWVADYEWV